jgi:Ca2+-binding RTX toxin-like protein
MTVYTGTNGNDSWTLVAGGNFTIDGLGGIDTLSTGTQPRSDFIVFVNADGTIEIDTVSGASQELHATLKNMEFIVFDNGRDVLDLRALLDSTPPTLTSSTPASGATGVAVGADIVLTFSEPIVLGTGTVTLQNAAGQTVEAYTAGASGNLSVSGNTLRINPTADLAAGGSYTVTVSGGAVKDVTGNALAAAASVTFSTDAKTTVGANNAPLPGTAGNDVLVGDARNNVFIGSTGHDTIDGGAGLDTLRMAGTAASFHVTVNGASATVSDAAGNVTNLTGVERIEFGDTMFALDIAGNAGQVYRIYQAAFNRAPDAGGLGYWIGVMDAGTSLTEISSGFVNSAEFRAMYGANPTNASIATTMYMNVLHRAPDAAGLAFWAGMLDNHTATVAEVLAGFSESAENQQNVITVIGNGFAYTPFH